MAQGLNNWSPAIASQVREESL